MKYLKKFKLFEEHSKNDPIPELARSEKLGVILLGAPGIGKSTFISKFIQPRNPNIKTFSTDDVSLTFTKDPETYHQTASKLNLERLFYFIDSQKSFIYDTTGTQIQNIKNIYEKSIQNGFDIIFIHLIGSLEMAEKGNLQRDRSVPIDYLLNSYQKQKNNIQEYLNLNPKAYYLVEREKLEYQFYKFDEVGNILKRNELGEYIESENNILNKY
jgi:predicted ABC-type ATPase